MDNAIYGKAVENLKNTDERLSNNTKDYLKWIS